MFLNQFNNCNSLKIYLLTFLVVSCFSTQADDYSEEVIYTSSTVKTESVEDSKLNNSEETEITNISNSNNSSQVGLYSEDDIDIDEITSSSSYGSSLDILPGSESTNNTYYGLFAASSLTSGMSNKLFNLSTNASSS